MKFFVIILGFCISFVQIHGQIRSSDDDDRGPPIRPNGSAGGSRDPSNAGIAAAPRRVDDDVPEDEGSVKSKPVIIRLPKNRLSPEIQPISSLKNSHDSEEPKPKIEPITDTPDFPQVPNINLPSARPIDIQPRPASPSPVRIPFIQPPVPTISPSQLRPAIPSPAAVQRPQLQLPAQLPSNPLTSALGAGGSNLAGLLSSNPSLLKLLQGVSGPTAAGGSGGIGGAAGPLSSLSGLLAPIQGAIPSLGAQSPAFAGAPGVGPPGTSSDNGLLNVISSLGRQLGGAVGLNGIIPNNSPQVGPSIPRISGLGGPPIAGIPNIPGLPIFPGAITPGGQLDVLQLISAISRRALNGSSVTDVLPPNQIQKLADNLTDTLLPETPDIDLTKYMGRWFEGINSPRATDQRCVVHHYGGLTENGKTATFTALKIYREASEFGQVRYSIGYAFRGGRQEGMLQMHTSEASDPIPYWVYRVGPTGKDPFGNEQYEYAIISNWIRYPVMVLVRDPDQFKRDHEESVLRWLEEKGFINGFVRAFNLIQPVSYQNCQYADSTFELFG